MGVLPIRKYGDPILKKRCKEIKEITAEIKNLIEDMKQTMEKKGGIGLAAPQVGQLKRVIVVQTGVGPFGFINPQIVKKTKETKTAEEGCLSFPGIWVKIKRAWGVEIKALDINGKEVQIKAEGLLARIFQHEIDHLDGILFIDRLNFFQKLKIKKHLSKIKKHFKKTGGNIGGNINE